MIDLQWSMRVTPLGCALLQAACYQRYSNEDIDVLLDGVYEACR